MEAMFFPRDVLCGACGGPMYVTPRALPDRQVLVHCLRSTCAEHRKRYLLPFEVRELQPVPTTEAA